jgi:hypothetical protein
MGRFWGDQPNDFLCKRAAVRRANYAVRSIAKAGRRRSMRPVLRRLDKSKYATWLPSDLTFSCSLELRGWVKSTLNSGLAKKVPRISRESFHFLKFRLSEKQLHGSITYMLTICSDIVPQSKLSYLAFRLAAFETFKLLEFAQQSGQDFRDPYGYLTEVPFLKETAPQVQLSILADTWSKLISPVHHHATLVDESVLYAACETSARILEHIPELFHSFTETGPVRFLNQPDKLMIRDLRAIHLDLANEGDFLLISQFLDLCPTEARKYKKQFRMSEFCIEPLFDVLALWHCIPGIEQKFTGLFTPDELQELMPVLTAACGGLRLT